MSAHSHDESEAKMTTLSETDHFMIYTLEDTEGELTYNLELGNVTLHFFREEWDEFVRLVRAATKK